MKRIQVTNRFHSVTRAVATALLVFPFLAILLPVDAADLTNRSIRISSPEVSVAVDHVFTFDNITATTLGSIVFEYCDSPLVSVACNPTTGLDVSGAVLSAQTGNVGFAVHANTTANRLVIGRVPAGTLPITNSYTFTNTINPSTTNQTYFVRISLLNNDDGTGAAIDQGSVAYSTSGSFSVGAYVPPFLIFCVGVTVAPDCSTTTGNLVSFGVLNANLPALATTQFAGATNDPLGYQVFMNGQTMTSGNNIIPELTIPTGSSPGTSQFGMNMRLNNSPVVGSDRSGAGTGNIDPKYNSSNLFAFGDGDTLVNSTLSSDYNRFTQSYIVNVNINQNPGVYATSLLYTAVAAF